MLLQLAIIFPNQTSPPTIKKKLINSDTPLSLGITESKNRCSGSVSIHV
jgi:hypothetical protein